MPARAQEGGECFYNMMPCYFKCGIVHCQPWAPKSHCVCVGGGSVEVDKLAVNTQERFWEALSGGQGAGEGGVLPCAGKSRPVQSFLEKLFLFCCYNNAKFLKIIPY